MQTKKSLYVWLILIFLVASGFRLFRIELMEYKADETINVFLATQLAFNNPLPPGGTVSSVGILNPPLFTYLLVPVTFLSTNPRDIAIAIALTNALGVCIFFFLVRRYYTLPLALFSTLLLSLAPWPILYSRKIWTQDLIFPLSVLFLFFLHEALLRKRKVFWLLCGISLAFLAQLHMGNVLIILLFLGYSLLRQLPLSWKWFLSGLALGSIPLLPYLLFQFQSCIGCSAYTASSHPLNLSLLLHFLLPMELIGIANFGAMFGVDYPVFLNQYYPLGWIRYLQPLFILATVAGGILYWRENKKLRIIPYLFFSTPFVFMLLRLDTFAHYYLSLLPIASFFIGYCFTKMYLNQNTILKLVSIVLFGFVLCCFVIFDIAFFRFLSEHKSLKGDYGNSFLMSEAIAKKRLSEYAHYPEYQEMFIASFVPLQSVSGPDTIASLVYPMQLTTEQLSDFDTRLIAVPGDPRIHLALTAYYTKTPLTEDTLRFLAEKTKTIPGYSPIFGAVIDEYINVNHLTKERLNFP